ncbi:hypothetical protein [Psychromarinibacter sp. S121]|uniref:hypothetical protein n=1 Tax=Psychromarinibacter sp. S121 TaxID=3415127 RepID=UPI003C7D4F47
MSQPLATAELRPLVDTRDHRISYMAGTSDRLVVSLAGVGAQPKELPPFEFMGTAWDQGRNHVLLATERRRSWLNDAAYSGELVRQIETLVEQLSIRDIVCLGNSMGAYMALNLPQLTRVDCVIAFSPQYSMSSLHVPEEVRWSRWRDRIKEFRFPTVEALDPSQRDYFVLHGNTVLERIHWQRFPQDPRLHHFIFRGEGHNLVQRLKDEEMLTDAVRMAIARKPRRLRRLLEGAFDVARRETLSPDEAHLPLGD